MSREPARCQPRVSQVPARSRAKGDRHCRLMTLTDLHHLTTDDGHRTDTGDAPTLRVVAWRDPLVDALGFDPRSLYVEHFWLPVIGPTCTWLLRRLAARLERQQGGFDLDLEDTARSLGLGGHQGRHSPFGRAMARCITFELARRQGQGTIGVRRMLPPLARRHLLRLPEDLQLAHGRWTSKLSPPSSMEAHQRRARRLALGLAALGEDFDTAETQLLRWGVHPSLTHEAVAWARRLHASAGGDDRPAPQECVEPPQKTRS